MERSGPVFVLTNGVGPRLTADAFELVRSPAVVRWWGTMCGGADLDAKVRGGEPDCRGAEEGAVHGLLPVINPVGRYEQCLDSTGKKAGGEPCGVSSCWPECMGEDLHSERPRYAVNGECVVPSARSAQDASRKCRKSLAASCLPEVA